MCWAWGLACFRFKEKGPALEPQVDASATWVYYIYMKYVTYKCAPIRDAGQIQEDLKYLRP